MAKRPPIPVELERAVLIESGHRCAIPTCRQVPVELAHIVRWSKCRAHAFDNLIALCPTCHTRFDTEQIDRKAMQLYKWNLRLVNGRYGDLERRVIRGFARDRRTDEFWWFADMDIFLECLIEDGILEDTGDSRNVGSLLQKRFRLTASGRDYIANWPEN